MAAFPPPSASPLFQALLQEVAQLPAGQQEALEPLLGELANLLIQPLAIAKPANEAVVAIAPPSVPDSPPTLLEELAAQALDDLLNP